MAVVDGRHWTGILSVFAGNIIYWILRVLGQVFKWVPYPLTCIFAFVFFVLFCLCAPGRVRIALFNLSLAFPDRSVAWRLRVFFASMIHLGLVVWESMWLPAMTPRDIRRKCAINNDGLTALMRRHGALVLTAHIGNWEYLAIWASQNVNRLAIVYRYFRQQWIETLWRKTRTQHGVDLISESKSAFDVLRKVSQKYLVGIIHDQHIAPPDGIIVPFFGIPCGTSPGLATLQMRTYQYVFPAICFRDWRTGKFRVYVDGKLSPEKRRLEDYQAQVHDLTRQYNKYIEKWIRQHPEQWMWIHRRFKYAYDYATHKKHER